MPKNESYSVYVEGVEDMDAGTKVTVTGEGVVGEGGMVEVAEFTAKGGPNSADRAMKDMMGGGMKKRGGLHADEVDEE